MKYDLKYFNEFYEKLSKLLKIVQSRKFPDRLLQNKKIIFSMIQEQNTLYDLTYKYAQKVHECSDMLDQSLIHKIKILFSEIEKELQMRLDWFEKEQLHIKEIFEKVKDIKKYQAWSEKFQMKKSFFNLPRKDNRIDWKV